MIHGGADDVVPQLLRVRIHIFHKSNALRIQRGQLVYKRQRMGKFIGKGLQFFWRKAKAGQVGQSRNLLKFHGL